MRDRGSSTVEFALVLPLILLAALAIVQVALLGRDALAVANAAREGAREAAVSTEEERVVSAALRAGLPADRTEVRVVRGGGQGDPVTVRVAYRSPLAVPFVEWLFPEEVRLEAEATMRQEAP